MGKGRMKQEQGKNAKGRQSREESGRISEGWDKIEKALNSVLSRKRGKEIQGY
jgi:hypothetical protein